MEVNRAPHIPQNRELSGSCAPQMLQYMTNLSLPDVIIIMVSQTDLTVLVRYLSGYSETTLALNLDPNGDGKTNNRDAIELIKALSE